MFWRREFLIALMLTAAVLSRDAAWAKDDGSDNSGSGSSNSGSGSTNSGSDGSGDDGAGDGSDSSGSGSHNSGKYKDQYDARKAVSSGYAMSLEAALGKLRTQYPGKVISVNLGEAGSRLVYWFKVKSSDGNVRKVVMDAKTGEIRGLFGFRGS